MPRRGEITAALRQGLEQFRDATLAVDEFRLRLQRATINIPRVFAALQQQILPEAESDDQAGSAPDSMLHSVSLSLAAAEALFLSGLEEMLKGLELQDELPLHCGWLLIEKAEDEYISVLKSLCRVSSKSLSLQPDTFGRLTGAYHRGELSLDGLRQGLDQLEDQLSGLLEQSWQDISLGFEQARSFQGEQPVKLDGARAQLQKAAEGLGQGLLALRAPG